MASDDTRGTSGTRASPIRSMTTLDKMASPMVANRETSGKGGSTITAEPLDDQQPPTPERHLPPTIVSTASAPTQPPQPPLLLSMASTYVTTLIPLQQHTLVQMTIPPTTLLQTSLSGQPVVVQTTMSKMPPPLNSMTQGQLPILQTTWPLNQITSTQLPFYAPPVNHAPVETQPAFSLPPLAQAMATQLLAFFFPPFATNVTLVATNPYHQQTTMSNL